MTPREQRITRKKWKNYSNYWRKKQLFKQTTNNFIRQNTPPPTDDEIQPIIREENRPVINEDQRPKKAKKRSERQRKSRNRELKKIRVIVSKLKTKLNTQRQKYKRVKKQLKKVVKSIEKTPKTSIEDMSEDITKKKELVKKALFREVIKIQLEENYTKLKTHEERKKFNQEDDSNSREAAGKKEQQIKGLLQECPGIKVDVIELYEIVQMNTNINDKSSEMVAFKGTLLVHQVTGTAYIPNNLTMKSLSCFCNPDGCDHYKLGSINYETELCAKNSTRLNTSTVFSDSEDDIPLSTYVRDNDDRFELNRDKSLPGVSGYSQHQSRYSSGDYVLVKYVTKKTEYHYAAICSSVDDEDGELRVTFLKICNQTGTLFKLNERGVSDVPVDQIIKKLPVPNLITKGNRVFYQFKENIDVFEN
ncbi:hypothetical protein FQA39_LY00628 [Lamprigera yunnana]|nr:hypothetical protein FQA39_LY00628 [Lamprigera yunnana]